MGIKKREQEMTSDKTKSSFELLLKISRELATTLELRESLEKVIFLSTENVGAERGSLIAITESKHPIEAAIFTDKKFIAHTVPQLRAILDHGLAGWVVENQEPVWIEDTSKDPRWLRRPDDSKEQTGSKSAICLPLRARDQLVGVLTIVHPQPNFFTEDQYNMLLTIADLAGIAIHNASLYASLQSSNQRYQELFEDSIDPIFITDWKGNITEVNRQGSQCIGMDPHSGISYRMQDFHTVNWDELGENFIHLRAGKVANYESEMHCINNTSIPVEIHVRKVLINDLEVLQWIVRDISERKALDNLREDLMAMIYHDLRSPLANIISSLDIMKTLLPEGDENLDPVFQIAVRSTDRLQRLINSLLDIKRLEAGQPITGLEEFSVTNLFEYAREAVLPVIHSKRQNLHIDLEENLSNLTADIGMIRRVIINLLENAIKFTPLDGDIYLGAKNEGDQLLFWVADSGPGIPDEQRERIFNKFTRLQAERFPKGIGLGLAFCKLAVTAHNGKIWVESKKGSGSRFNILLPTHQN